MKKQNLYTKTNALRYEAESIQWYLDNFQKIAPTEQEEHLELVSFQVEDYWKTGSKTQVIFKEVGTTHRNPIGQHSTGWEKVHIYELGWEGYYLQKGKHDWFISFTGKPEGFNSGSGGPDKHEFCVFIKDLPKVYKKFQEYMEDLIPFYKLASSSSVEDRQIALAIWEVKQESLEYLVNMLSYNNLMKNDYATIYHICKFWENYNKQPIKFETHSEIPLRN